MEFLKRLKNLLFREKVEKTIKFRAIIPLKQEKPQKTIKGTTKTKKKLKH